jgi:transcriptional repressor NrdR
VICPFCKANDDKVIDSRSTESGAVIRRRRECLACAKRFTTYEHAEDLARITVVKKDLRREPFDREKLMRGIRSAFGKRPVSEETKARLVTEIEESLFRDFDREVESVEIGKRVCEKLKVVDEVAYIRFASVYHQFRDVTELANELASLLNRPKDVKDQGKLFGS